MIFILVSLPPATYIAYKEAKKTTIKGSSKVSSDELDEVLCETANLFV